MIRFAMSTDAASPMCALGQSTGLSMSTCEATRFRRQVGPSEPAAERNEPDAPAGWTVTVLVVDLIGAQANLDSIPAEFCMREIEAMFKAIVSVAPRIIGTIVLQYTAASRRCPLEYSL